MYVITNRSLHKDRDGLDAFSKRPQSGPNELRLTRVTRSGKKWNVEILADELSTQEVQRLADEHGLDLDLNETHYQSLKVACELFQEARDSGKQLLFYVHGYNNDMRDVIASCMELETSYPNLIVVPFSWPADGGGKITGTAAYKRDKVDARASTGAFDRFLEKIHGYHRLLTSAALRALQEEIEARTEDNHEEFRTRMSERMEARCKTRISLAMHSMGNYLAKHSLRPSDAMLSELVFDNICLIAADTNLERHSTWLDRMQVRGNVYVVINRNDFALKWSRRKPGVEQRERLGHSVRLLDSELAIYVNVTDADLVETKHDYFKGEAVKDNKELRAMFQDMFEGRAAHDRLTFHPSNGTYTLD